MHWAALAFAFLLASAGVAEGDTPACESLKTVAMSENLTELLHLIDSLKDSAPEAVDFSLESPAAPDMRSTTFAPSNAALGALDLSDPFYAERVLTTHILDGAVTSEDLSSALETSPQGVFVASLSGDTLVVQRSSSAPAFSVKVYGTADEPVDIVIADIGSCAGPVHMIQGVLRPAACATLADALVKSPATAALFELAGSVFSEEELALLEDPSAMLTIFAPSAAALDDLSTAALAGDIDPELAADVLRLHISPAATRGEDLADGALLPTLLPGAQLRITVGADGKVTVAPTPGTTVAEVVQIDAEACAQDAAIHVIDDVLVPAGLDLAAVLGGVGTPAPAPAALEGPSPAADAPPVERPFMTEEAELASTATTHVLLGSLASAALAVAAVL